MKRLPFNKLSLRDGRSIRILNPGLYNEFASGPDFFNAKIELDGITWVGNVEIHLKSSDWYAHNHHHDEAYDNVILHVVLSDDKPVYQNGILIPVLEIGEFIEEDHYRKFLNFLKAANDIPCGSLISHVDELFIKETLDRSAADRFERKSMELDILFPKNKSEEVLYFLLARAFGAKQNAMAFEELSVRLPPSVLKSNKEIRNKELIRWTSGIFESSSIKGFESKPFAINPMKKSTWKTGGIRPASSPYIRIEQFASIISTIDFDYVKSQDDVTIFLAYFNDILNRHNLHCEKRFSISKELRNLLLINGLLPYLFWRNRGRDSEANNLVLEVLNELPAEQNRMVEFWAKRGVKANSALDSQGLLELHGQRCLKKKCLTCGIGNRILKG